MRWSLVKRRGRLLLRIQVGGKSKAIRRAEKRIEKRMIEIHQHFPKKEEATP